jgi:hypothetical protein
MEAMLVYKGVHISAPLYEGQGCTLHKSWHKGTKGTKVQRAQRYKGHKGTMPARVKVPLLLVYACRQGNKGNVYLLGRLLGTRQPSRFHYYL